MKSKSITVILITFALLTRIALADEWQDIAKYNYGDDPNPCEQAEQILAETAPTQYRPIEDKLIAVVKSESATQDGKSIACRFLQLVGTDRCIPAVAPLLEDKVLSHYARLVLERLQSPSADKAMRDALPNVPNAAKIGILGSLGVRADRKAVEHVGRLTGSSDAAVAKAAIEALGKIGGREAAKQLLSMKPPKNLRAAQMKAAVACSKSLPPADAGIICMKVIADGGAPSKAAAIKQLTVVAPKKALPIIAGAIKGSDPEMRQAAIAIVADTKDRTVTTGMITLLGQLPDSRKAELITALGTRGDSGALKSVSRYLGSNDIATRRAAVKAVSKLGGPGDVKALLAAVDKQEMSDPVTRAIVAMDGERIDAELVDALASKKLRKPAIEASIARGNKAAVPALMKLTREREAEVSKDAWAGLGSLADADHVDAMMDIILKIDDTTELGSAEGAMRNIFSRAKDRDKCFQAVASRYDRASNAVKASILDLSAAIGNSDALKLQRSALKSGNKKLATAALRSLAKWPNETAAADLLALAQNASEAVDRIVALRGYIRIAGLNTAKLSNADRVKMLQIAMKTATRPEEKKQVIGMLQNVKSPQSLKMLEEYFDDATLSTEAQMSAANMLWDMRKKPSPQVKAIAEKLAGSKNKTVADKARRVLKELNKNK